jgi:hypothetical protein
MSDAELPQAPDIFVAPDNTVHPDDIKQEEDKA